MPLYTFTCFCTLDLVHERLCKYSEKDEQVCEKCGRKMTYQAAPCKGYVTGSTTPVKQ